MVRNAEEFIHSIGFEGLNKFILTDRLAKNSREFLAPNYHKL
jgi:hypothetical protein